MQSCLKDKRAKYIYHLKARKQWQQLRQGPISGLCSHSFSYTWKAEAVVLLVWGVTLSHVTSFHLFKVNLSHAIRLERLVNSPIGKWLGLPRCLTSKGQYFTELWVWFWFLILSPVPFQLDYYFFNFLINLLIWYRFSTGTKSHDFSVGISELNPASAPFHLF